MPRPKSNPVKKAELEVKKLKLQLKKIEAKIKKELAKAKKAKSTKVKAKRRGRPPKKITPLTVGGQKEGASLKTHKKRGRPRKVI